MCIRDRHTVVKKQKMSLAEKRATMHGVQTYLSDEDYEDVYKRQALIQTFAVPWCFPL